MVGQLSLLEVQEANSSATNTTNTRFFIQLVFDDIEYSKLLYSKRKTCGRMLG